MPAQVGRYRIEGILGEGASAVVYAGYDPEIERKVAIKCLHREAADDAGYRRRFQVEARAAGHLNHPHLVTIFDTGETADSRPYIAMERLTGDSLASRVEKEGLPPLPVIMNMAMQIAGALDYAHGEGVVHHDIKPENIMFMEGWKHAKLSDFGIAERRGAPRDVDGGEHRRLIGGTPSFMALERLEGNRADARSDLFSLGVVLYWLLTGKLPWNEIGDVQRLVKERKRHPQPGIEPRDPSTPSILIGIVRTLLAQAPDARYQSARELIDDLRLAQREYERLQENPLAGRIISLRVRWASMLGVTLTLVLLVGLAAIYSKQRAAVNGLGLDYGSSLGRMIAHESAENLLLGDRAATRALVEDIARNRQIHYIAIANHEGATIASTVPSEVGKPLPALSADDFLSREDDVDSYRSRVRGEQDEMLLFATPILYQDKVVGNLRLGVSNAPLIAAQHTTLWVIAIVLAVTLAAVIGAAYWLFRRPLILLDLLSEALLRVARGDFRYRIRLVRHDELGRLFTAFNLMNQSLYARLRAAGQSGRRRTVERIVQTTQILPATDTGARDEDTDDDAPSS
ncbi:protein kinase domain-containing protein [Oleiagrimonas soli]|nr:protein kinase [Oleiagrimonas soli]